MHSIEQWPPPYNIRRSQKAKHIRLNINPKSGLEIVIPQFISEKEALNFLNSKRSWVEKHATLLDPNNIKYEAKRFELPHLIELRALSRSCDIRYHHFPKASRIAFYDINDKLIFSGKINDFEPCLPAMKRWLKKQAVVYLTPWVEQIARECQLVFNQLTFRSQQTLWGSCSKDHNISLNYKLLFLPDRLVRYVFIHELCHIVHLNHSKRFWNRVARHEPNYKVLERELRMADHFIPKWL